MKSRSIALIALLATIYVVIGYTLHSISFLEYQVRVSDALYPLIAIFGLPAVIGTTIGHFIMNITSPLGIIDLLSVALFIPAKLAIWKYGLKAVPLHVISVALWVPYMLCTVFQIPFIMYWPLVLSVGIGETIAEVVIGVPLTLAVKNRVSKLIGK